MAVSLDDAKAAVRSLGLARRDALSADIRESASLKISRSLMALVEGRAIGSVAGYLPIRSEVDPKRCMDDLAARGVHVGVPAIVDGELLFRQLGDSTRMEPQGFGTMAPGDAARQLHPDLLIVPLAAFDSEGGRCGYGRGFYDRAIARLAARGPLLTIGVAFEVQRVETVPMGRHDRALDMIVTESAVHHRSREPAR